MNELRERLDEIAATPRPVGAPGVSPSAAREKGRRIRRRRHVAAAAGTALAVAIAGVLAVPEGDGHRQRATVLASPQAYGPVLEKEAVFGWLPSGYTVLRVSRDADGFTATAARPGMQGGGMNLQLTRGAEPAVPNLPGGRPGHRTATAPVRGRPAFWVIKPGADGSDQVPAEFRWQYADGRWAELVVVDKDVATEATVRRIAENVRFGTGQAAAFPVRIGGVPAGMRVARAWIGTSPAPRGRDTPSPGQGVEFALAPERGTLDGDGFSVSLTPESPLRPVWVGSNGKGVRVTPNTKVGGRPAFQRIVTDRATGKQVDMLTVYGWLGYDVQIELRGWSLKALAAQGGSRAVFDRIAYLGDDQAKWTTTPLG
ncbi:hypothetical protein AB0L06_36765 [Spirillospora sp. NPDC052269]